MIVGIEIEPGSMIKRWPRWIIKRWLRGSRDGLKLYDSEKAWRDDQAMSSRENQEVACRDELRDGQG